MPFRTPRACAGALVAVSLWVLTSCGSEGRDGPALASSSGALTSVDPHALHVARAGAECMDCHMPHDGMFIPLVSFSDRARVPGGAEPVLNDDRSCSNVACHAVPAGTFSYWAIGGDGEATLNEVSYGGVPVRTPPWAEATSDGCRACHGNPPSPAAGAWHTGRHGNVMGGPLNACSLCHRSVAIVNGAIAIRAGSEAVHRNGVADVSAQWRSGCYGCH